MIFSAPHDIVDVDLEDELSAAFSLKKNNGYDFFFNIAARKLYEAIGSPKNHIVAVYPKDFPRQFEKGELARQRITYFGNATKRWAQYERNFNIYSSSYFFMDDFTPEKVERRIRLEGRCAEGNLDDYSFTLYETVADKDTRGFITEKLRDREKKLKGKPTPVDCVDFDERGLKWW